MEFAKIVLSTLLSYAALFLCAKVIGRKQIAQLNFLDYITGITIGSIAAELATDLENMWKPLAAMGVYALLTWLLSLIGKRAARSRKFLDGTPTIIMQNGKLYRSNMKKAKLDLSEFMVMCREQGYFNLADIHTAVFEYNGKLTILPVSKKRPATPEDMKLSPEQETLSTEVIMVSLMCAVASIPLPVGRFTGCICAICCGGREFRLATYRGARAERWSEEGAVIRQGRYRLEIDVLSAQGLPLRAPVQGEMTRTIRESLCAKVRYRFSDREQLLFDHTDDGAGFEFSRS